MKILHLETSSKNCSVAVSEDDQLLCLCEESSQDYKQSENLHLFVQWALEGAELQLKDMEAVCIGKGPGSYTGLRIGAASAKGFCYALNIPLVAVNSLDSLAEPWFDQSYDFVIPAVDARRNEIYCKVFSGDGKEVSATQAKILDENSFTEYRDAKVLIVGDGAQKASEILQLRNTVYDFYKKYPSAQYLIKKGNQALKEGKFENIALFEPFYLKDFQGKKIKDQK